MDMQRALGIIGPVVIATVVFVSFGNMISGTAQVPTANVINQPLAPSPAPAGPVKAAQLGYKDYGFYFPETSSDLLTVSPGQTVRFEMLLDGPNKLVGCMKSVKLPPALGGALKVARPGDNILQFTAPTTPGDYSFTCGMGMGVGQIRVSL